MRIGAFVILVATLGQPAAAQISTEQRSRLIEFYPCAARLSDEALFELSEWANAVRQDPCMLSAEEFTALFVAGSPIAGSAPIDIVRTALADGPPSLLWMQQVLLFGRDAADGIWGPMTEARFAQLLDTYHAIGGIGEDWGVRTVEDVPRFLSWVLSAEFAAATGGEFPD